MSIVSVEYVQILMGVRRSCPLQESERPFQGTAWQVNTPSEANTEGSD